MLYLLSGLLSQTALSEANQRLKWIKLSNELVVLNVPHSGRLLVEQDERKKADLLIIM